MSTTSANRSFVFGDIGHCLACGFGLGLTPKIPGTAGTILAIPLFWLTSSVLALPPAAELALLAAMIAGGIWLCGRTAKALNAKDDQGIVFDEITGFYGVLILLPDNLQLQAAGFVLFRILDAVKPPPIGWLDRNIPGGAGIMLDDIAAAAVTIAALHFVIPA